jgi:hypothetical protein
MTTFSMTEVCHIVMREGITCYIEHTGSGVMTIFAGKLIGEVGHGALWTVAAGPGHQVDRIVVASTEDFYVGQGGTSLRRTEDLWKCPSNATAAVIAGVIISQARERDAQTPVVTPAKTWPETPEEQVAFVAWQYEVVAGNTVYGFRDWLADEKKEREQ